MSERDVAIVGMECVFPGARNLAEYWYNLVDAVDAIRDVPPGRLNRRDAIGTANGEYPKQSRGGFLPDDLQFEPLRFGIMPNIVPQGDPDQFLMLEVIDGALADAGIGEDAPARQSCDVIIGRGGYITNKMSEIYYRADLVPQLIRYLSDRFPQLEDARQRQQLAEELAELLPKNDVDNVSTCVPNLVASRVANRLNLRGAAYTVDAACASSLLSVEQAVQRLRLGLCDAAVAGGIFLCQTPCFWYIFTELGAISPSSQIRPFDRRADGLLVGEGAGAVVLKRLEDAVRDGNQVYAIVKGVGTASDGRQVHILASSSVGQVEALRRAYRDAQLDAATIGYLEAHGTGTMVGDSAELETIKQFWGRRDRFPPTRAMGSVKSMIGHTMPAAGIASLIKVALSLSNKTLLPSLHCDQPREELSDASFYINRETRPWIHAAARHPRRAGINAFGFGGINVHVVLEEAVESADRSGRGIRCRPYHPGRRPSELLLFSGSSQQELLARVRALDAHLASAAGRVTLHDLAATLADEVDFEASHKLAMVAADLEQLVCLLSRCLAGLEQESPALDSENIYYSASAREPVGKVAGIFPGIGFPGLIGTYPNHLMELCQFFPEVREQFDRIELRDEHPEDPTPTSLVFLPPTAFPAEQQLELRSRIAAMKVIEQSEGDAIALSPWERNIAAPGVTLANWVSWILLEKLKIPIDMLCGQSQGEIAAMCAADVLSMDEVIPRFWKGLKVSPGYAGRGRLAFVVASEDRIAPYLAKSPDTSIAIHVAPEMLILGGSNEHLYDLAGELKSLGVIVTLMPYPPIHTPRLSHMRDELRQILDLEMPFRKPAIPLYSALTESLFPEEESAIRELALSNLDWPVRFWQTIHRMYDAGARVFLQIGGGSLASNIRTILPRSDILGSAVDVDHRHPLTQLEHLCATLFTAGIRFRPQFLYQYPQPRRVDLARPNASAPSVALALPLRMDWAPLAELVGRPSREAGVPRPTTDTGSDSVEVATGAPSETGTSQPRPVDPTSPAEDDWTAGLPLVGRVVERIAGQRIATRRVLSLGEDVFLHDHAVIDEMSGKAIENRMAIFPMAFILESAAEAAVKLLPELGVIGFEKITAMRWIDFHDTSAVELQIEGHLASVDTDTGVHRVAVEIQANGKTSGTATVLLADYYREDVRLTFRELTNAGPLSMTPTEIYTQRHMFHGPRFQCISNIDLIGDEGLIGELTVLPKDDLFASIPEPILLLDPVVLDGVLQLMAMWVIAHGAFLMPAKITRLEFYRPAPDPGARVPVRIEIRSVDPQGRTVTADAEVQDGEGQVWFRMEGINEWLYQYSPQLQRTERLPCRYHVSTPVELPTAPAGSITTMVRRADLRHANMEWLARLYLSQEEWLYYEQLPTLQKQVGWLMGRIAAKDAARISMASINGGEMLHPALLEVAADGAGKPYGIPLVGEHEAPEISIAHADQFAAAMAASGSCGVDIELRTRETRSDLSEFATAQETQLVDAMADQLEDATWPARLWCAKTAVAKLLGTGVAGRPGDFEAIDVDQDGQLLVLYRPSGESYVAGTWTDDELVYACVEAGAVGVAKDESGASSYGVFAPSERSLP